MNETLMFIPSHKDGVVYCSYSYNAKTKHNDVNYAIPSKTTFCLVPSDGIDINTDKFTATSNGVIVPYDGLILVQMQIILYSTSNSQNSSNTPNLNCTFGIGKNGSGGEATIAINVPRYYGNASKILQVNKGDEISAVVYDYVPNAHVRALSVNIVYL